MNKDIKHTIFQTAFHGETYFKCPWCGESFEDYDVDFGRGFEKTDTEGVYMHKCGNKVYHN